MIQENIPTHTETVLAHWDKLQSLNKGETSSSSLDGQHLTLADVLHITKLGNSVSIDDDALQRLSQGAGVVKLALERGEVIYGVNTGFGGSADVRTNKTTELQRALLRELHCGMLSDPMTTKHQPTNTNGEPLINGAYEQHIRKASSTEKYDSNNCLLEPWVRGAILIRINSLISGCSGTRRDVVDRMAQLLEKNITPRIPLRGSISASGDLMPLSYIGGTIQGKPTITVLAGPEGHRRVMSAQQAFVDAELQPVQFGPKESLAIVNGTAVSCSAAAVTLHDTHVLAMLAQMLTAMSVEALNGSDESFSPFFARKRPHPGQIESSDNIRRFLRQSKLVARQDPQDSESGVLRQDRYSLRTASQWLSPVLEDLQLAHQQVSIELNSVTDNPLIDYETGEFLHGGNFQARALTSASEKMRQAIQSIGRMLFTQSTEIVNPATNRGLPPNLVPDEPSGSFVFKGVDIATAALTSELGFLANPVGSHVQSAEMGNQALNSLALISARYTATAIDVLQQLAAYHLLVLCQAVDLRVMERSFLEQVEPSFNALVDDFAVQHLPADVGPKLRSTLWAALRKNLANTTTLDSDARFNTITETLQVLLLKHLPASSSGAGLAALKAWQSDAAALLLDTFHVNKEAYVAHGDAAPFLGSSSRALYRFVRDELRVPLLVSSGVLCSPDPELVAERIKKGEGEAPHDEKRTLTIGAYATKICEAIKDGTLFGSTVECLRERKI